MSEFKTPGVFVEEVSKFPPSVAQVETAVPTFIGYTQTSPGNQVPKRISSLVEYETYFGGAKKESIRLQDTADGLTLVEPAVEFLMYYSLQMYFVNGGGPCYIVSAGNYPETGVKKSELLSGLDLWKDVDESTIVVFPDAVTLSEVDFYALYQEAISEAETLKNRFVVLDTYKGNSVDTVQVDNVPLNTIQYLRKQIPSTIHAAAYFPHLKTILNYIFNEETAIEHAGLQDDPTSSPFFTTAVSQLTALQTQVTAEQNIAVCKELLGDVITIVENVNVTADQLISLDTAKSYLEEESTATKANIVTEVGNLLDDVEAAKDVKGAADNKTLKYLKTTNSDLYNQIKKKIESLKVVLPPSSAIAGIYAKVDGVKGVWKAPANVALNYVVAPTEKISDEEQKSLNEDVVAGKSINAIRTFTGKGTLIWGARTFDSSTNEWRYISVRRLFDMIEKSVQNATERFVFEVNDASTWVRVKAMIENYLNQLWMSGALAGSTPEEAYKVKVGLQDQTMTSQDILEGRMNIEVAIAAVRPAEFIILRFSHKLQES